MSTTKTSSRKSTTPEPGCSSFPCWKWSLLVLVLPIVLSIGGFWLRKDGRLCGGDDSRPIAWVTGLNMEYGYLRHVLDIFKRLGYRTITTRTPPPRWDVLWSHEYPFIKSSFDLPMPLEPHQRVNHFPGSGFITNKVNLATSGLKHIPRAFNIPADRDKFLAYAKENPDKRWVQKDNNHRGIRIRSLDELNLSKAGTFVQEFIDNPLLIDGRKFDIGLYVTLTSVNPLRVYIYDTDILLRFCYKDYLPFNGTDLDSYVVGDKYTPIWEMPSLQRYYVQAGLNAKQTLNAYVRTTLGKDPNELWAAVEESIKTIYYMKEEQIYKIAGAYQQTRNFFEMVRFDFALDDQLNVYLMEANMSPNLASAKYPPNALLYEQVIFSLFSLTGIARHPQLASWHDRRTSSWGMMVLEKDLAILPEVCASDRCLNTTTTTTVDTGVCNDEECDSCLRCLPADLRPILVDAYIEEYSRWHTERLIPDTSIEAPITLGPYNYLQDKWYIGKCLLDSRWCN